ncbi:MAG TPA: glycosyltransferase, partial [Anaerolineae bacterium]|nr:glycosyltransferase [Anaerolineae bacterium]
CPVKLADMVAGGVPVVAEGVGQVREYVVEGVNGVVCESGDVTGLVAGLVRLLTDEGERRRLGAMGGRRYEALFAWGQQVSVLERVYERLLGEKGD